MTAEDFEEDYLQTEKDFVCAVRKGLFMIVAILATGLVAYLAGGIMVALISVVCVVGTSAVLELINEWSDDYGEDNKKL